MRTRIYTKIMTPVFAMLALILFGATSIKAAPGDLDLSFGNGGMVVTPITSSGYRPYPVSRSMLVQPDGKIVVGGLIYDGDGNDDSFFLARYHPNGTLDASFGTDGKVIGPSSYDGVFTGNDIALQPDGKIVAVGFSFLPGNKGIAVHRYHANGTLDASFGAAGLVVTQVGTEYVRADSVAIQADGKIVVAGFAFLDPLSHFAVVRYNPNGSLDTSFNRTGKVITSFSGYSGASKVILQPDGKIVAAGSATDDFALVRYNPDGSLDSGFGAGGKVIHSVSSGSNRIRDAAIQADGKIVVTGETAITNNWTSPSATVRYHINGSVDTSFAQNGVFTTDQNSNFGNSIAVQSDGKLVASGYALNHNAYNGFAVARLNPGGTPDTGFGTNGRVITQIGTYSAASKAVLQPDGKILAVGTTNTPSIQIAVVRYLGDSSVPSQTQFDFDGDRRSDVSVFRPSDRTWYLNQSTNGFSATQFGLSTDKITPADFDGDSKTDIAVFRDGVWYWLNSVNQSIGIVQFGIASDIPLPADYTGDGRAELAVYRNGVWWSFDLLNDQASAIQFGLATDKPVVADYDGDGRADQAVYRGGEWHLNLSTQGYAFVNFGLSTDKPVIGDYDGDGRTDPAIYRDGIWHVLRSSQGYTAFQWGVSSDIPAPADYDGDGRTDAAVFRDGTWYLLQSTSGISIQQFGLTNDKPVPAAYLP